MSKISSYIADCVAAQALPATSIADGLVKLAALHDFTDGDIRGHVACMPDHMTRLVMSICADLASLVGRLDGIDQLVSVDRPDLPATRALS